METVETKLKGRIPNSLLNIIRDYAEIYGIELVPDRALESIRSEWAGLIDLHPIEDCEQYLEQTHVFSQFILSQYFPQDIYLTMVKNCIIPILEKYEIGSLLDYRSGIGIVATIAAKHGIRSYCYEDRGLLGEFAMEQAMIYHLPISFDLIQQVDAVFTGGGLSITRHPESIITEIDKVLRPGGILIVNTLPYILSYPFNPDDSEPEWKAILMHRGYLLIEDMTWQKPTGDTVNG